MDAWRSEGDFREKVAGDAAVRAVLTDAEIAEVFRLERYLGHVDDVFGRVFGPGA
jgi:adenylosuccinate lyase